MYRSCHILLDKSLLKCKNVATSCFSSNPGEGGNKECFLHGGRGGGILWNYTISLHVNVIRLIKINKLAPNALDHLL